MSQHVHAFAPHAAALQCVAEDFRRLATNRATDTSEFARYAGVLDHIAASLIVGDALERNGSTSARLLASR